MLREWSNPAHFSTLSKLQRNGKLRHVEQAVHLAINAPQVCLQPVSWSRHQLLNAPRETSARMCTKTESGAQ
eukprot:m.65700 g.65700  ORF g.65700 m.65700 type:complete len:72 (+) comp9778_c0_seq1:325-540(+)